MKPIPLLYTDEHELHAPKREYYHDRLVPYQENPYRVSGILDALLNKSLGSLIDSASIKIPEGFLELVHTNEYLELLLGYAQRNSLAEDTYHYPHTFATRSHMAHLANNPAGQMGFYAFDPFSPIGRNTARAALSAAQISYHGAELISQGLFDCVYVLSRPPGHHAGPDFFGGYCYINNAAIGARKLSQSGRVAILDLDVHHGNGTQTIFWDDPEVWFCSLHGAPEFEYPYYSGHTNETGGPNAAGTVLNIPFERGSTGDIYLRGLRKAIQHLGDFAPKFLVISMGYDAFKEDPVGNLGLEREDFKKIGREISQIELPTLIIQEGGYSLVKLPQLACAFVEGLIGT